MATAASATRSSAMLRTRVCHTDAGGSSTNGSARPSRRVPANNLDEEVGTLAIHYFEAQRWDKAWDFCRRAADRAGNIYANVEALGSLKAALVAGSHVRSVSRAELAGVHEQLGDTYSALGELGKADLSYGAARRLVAPDILGDARLAVKQVRLAAAMGHYRGALVRTTRTLGSLRRHRSREVAGQRARLRTGVDGSCHRRTGRQKRSSGINRVPRKLGAPATMRRSPKPTSALTPRILRAANLTERPTARSRLPSTSGLAILAPGPDAQQYGRHRSRHVELG